MENIYAMYPMESVHMDYLTIEGTEGGKDVHILVITDHSIWYAQTIVISSQTAKCTAQNVGQIHCPLWASWNDSNKSGT